MFSFIISIIVLIGGYFIYSKFTDKIFDSDNRLTPAIEFNDGVDRVPMNKGKLFLIQLLNIAGTGPIFGALMGAVFGPIVFLWIVLGSILAGAVHDFMSGMISSRHNGESVATLSGIYLGNAMKWIMRVFSILLLVLVGTVFITSPANLLASLSPDSFDSNFWIIIIIIYYIIATLVPIDKIIGKLYPIFGIILIIMAVSIACGIMFNNKYEMSEIVLKNLHPDNLPIWPFMFITVACGAISGFHATQSPMVAKCIKSEKDGRSIFYGAMIAEAVIALVWAAAGVAFYGTTEILNEALNKLGQSGVVYDISTNVLGAVGGILAIVGVIICPITSGDTAFRGARLICAESTKLDQSKIKNRLIISIPLFLIGGALTQLNFDILWRYFSWSNQTLAMISLWVSSAYLIKKSKYRFSSLITSIPASFMTAVSVTYILIAKEGFKLNKNISYTIGIVIAIFSFLYYLYVMYKNNKFSKSVIMD